MTQNLRKLLVEIEARPAMYLGRPSIFRLESFLFGYFTGKGKINQEDQFWEGFQPYIQSKYNITSSHSWARIIDFFATSESDAFNRFFQLYHEYLSEWSGNDMYGNEHNM